MPTIRGGNTWQHAQQVYGGPTQQHAISSVSNEIAYNLPGAQPQVQQIRGGRKTKSNRKISKKTKSKKTAKTKRSKTYRKRVLRGGTGTGAGTGAIPTNLDDLLAMQKGLSQQYSNIINSTSGGTSSSPIHVDETKM